MEILDRRNISSQYFRKSISENGIPEKTQNPHSQRLQYQLQSEIVVEVEERAPEHLNHHAVHQREFNATSFAGESAGFVVFLEQVILEKFDK
ncbi:hypothetical protein DdX_18823 [Ditylenchus destructor]|uniref:Uncharacterized protein n=1 Tax=Ditylenchus destructor TaxID=166010 RepID=A0AAD4QUK7_9BILA|nr:hypothetical protein DdX_18823 [Ditylenchus destructor]